MTARTRTAKATQTQPAAPAKKAAAKRATSTPRKPRTRAADKDTTPALSVVKEPAPNTATVVDLRHALPVRRRNFTGPYTPAQMAEARAALASATAQLPVPHLLWLAQIDGRAAARLADGTHLVHTHERAPQFTAYTRCPTGGLHAHTVTNDRDLKAARAITSTCTHRHDDTSKDGPYDWHNAITKGVQKLIPSRLSPLNAGLKTAKKATADTQSMSLNEIGAHIAEQLADKDTPKEHPQP